MEQDTALKRLKSKKNVFITGSAGSGKTYVLNKYIKYLKKKGTNVAITASTGIAATHIGGVTIHSWSGLGIRQGITDEVLESLEEKKYLWDRFDKVEVLIIDEISMLHKKNLDDVNKVLKHFKRNDKPFGGIQVILSGDFFQLPPVSSNGESNRDKFAFMANAWVEAQLNICYLTEQYRQDDERLLRLLNEIRSQECSQDTVDMLEDMKGNDFDDEMEAIKLFTHNVDVDNINDLELEKLDTKMRVYEADTQGKDTVVESLKRSVLAPDKLVLKVGAQVIFVKNNPDNGYMNGTMGKVIKFTTTGYPVVEKLDGTKITVDEMEWSINDESGKTQGSYKQVPLRLAWAITIHKSQGMSLDRAEIDLSKTFEPGQGYVALSRVKNFEGVKLIGYNEMTLRLDPLAFMADERFQSLSDNI